MLAVGIAFVFAVLFLYSQLFSVTPRSRTPQNCSNCAHCTHHTEVTAVSPIESNVSDYVQQSVPRFEDVKVEVKEHAEEKITQHPVEEVDGGWGAPEVSPSTGGDGWPSVSHSGNILVPGICS
jgi:hypothetical protein